MASSPTDRRARPAARTVLMIAHWFPPCSAYPTSAARAHGFASWLGDFGWRAIVLAPEAGTVCRTELPSVCEGCQLRASQEHREHEEVRVGVAVRPLETNQGMSLRTVAHKAGTLARLARANTGSLEVASDWPERVLDASRELLDHTRVDAVWATYTPLSSIWAANALAREHGLPWVADLRDAAATRWTLSNYRNLPALARGRRMLREADAVIDVTPDHAKMDSRWLQRPVETITSGFDPLRWASIVPSYRSDTAPVGHGSFQRGPHLQIVCAGKIYPGWLTLDPAFAGIRWLQDRDPDVPLRLVYYGRSVDEVRSSASRWGVEDLVECPGFIAPDALRTRLASADILLLPTNQAGASGVPGGKLYEYLAARRPILAVPGEDRYVAGVLRTTSSGVGATRPAEVGEVLEGWITEWRDTGRIARTADDAAVERYSIRESARQLATVLDRIAQDGNSNRSGRSPSLLLARSSSP